MEAIVSQSPSVLSFSVSLTFNKQPKLAKSFLFLREIADGQLILDSQKVCPQLTVSSVKDDGNRRGRSPRKNYAAGRTTEDNNEEPHSSGNKLSNSSNQEEIISLFRKIQSSISKGKSSSSKKKKSTSSEDESSYESVLEVLRQSTKQIEEKTSNNSGNQRSDPKNERAVQIDQTASDFKLSRPQSNFVKRSPVPSVTRGRDVEMNTEALQVTTRSNELPVLENLKLPELKELSKSRGLKGYSKLKKSELIKLLRS